jgi:hypothetical protein
MLSGQSAAYINVLKLRKSRRKNQSSGNLLKKGDFQMKKIIVSILAVMTTVLPNTNVFAGVPLNNIEGVGGVAFNPLAYPAGTAGDPNSSLGNIFSKPQIDAWYVKLPDVSIDWTTFGIAETFFNRLEVSYGREIIGWSGHDTIHKNNLGLKLLALKESDYLPAISFGTVFKNTTFDVPDGVDNSGVDFYLVGTKFIKALPLPVLVSGGVISTKGQTLGVLGFNESRKEVLFGNIDVLPIENVAVGFEYRQGARFDEFKNADYWETHIAWFVNKNLTLVGAYVYTGDSESTSKVGLGDGYVFSIQYAF